jgi:hypothetical protein
MGMNSVRTALILAFVSVSLPAHATSYEIDLRPGMPEPRSQGGDRNTCSAFAATELAEYLIRARDGSSPLLSPAYAYWAAKNFTLTTDFLRNMYAHVDGQAGYLAVQAYVRGAMLEKDWPYEEKNWQQLGDPRCTQDADGEPNSVCFTGQPPAGAPLQAYRIDSRLVERTELATFLRTERKPLVFNIMWYFAAADARGDFRLPTAAEVKACLQNGSGCGGHVVLIAGYDPASDRFLFLNSWGAGWGDRGYGSLPREYLEQHCEACEYLAGPSAGSLDAQTRAFLETVAQGVSGALLPVP